jgi:hypothetical protein
MPIRRSDGNAWSDRSAAQCMLAPVRDCTAPVGLKVHHSWGLSRGDAGGGTPSEGVWGNAPSWRGRGSYSTPDSKFSLAQA